MKKEARRSLALLFCLLLLEALAFGLLFRLDNKYTAALPGGLGYNVLEDPGRPAFLVDGWEYYPGELLSPSQLEDRTPSSYTYAGQYPNFSAHLGSPYGEATYCLILENRGEPRELVLYLPELLCAGKIYISGAPVGTQGSLSPYHPHVVDGLYSFRAGERTELVIQCANYTHYYSGMYYPPAVGDAGAVFRMLTGRMMVYGLLCFGSLALALYDLALWALGRDRLGRWMGLLCLSFSLRVSYPFLRALGIPLVRPLYALEDLCSGAVLLCALLLAGEVSGAASRRYHRSFAIPAAVGLCAFSTLFPLFILPYAPFFINPYGSILFLWKLLAGGYLLFLALGGAWEDTSLARYLLCAAGLYGLSTLFSLLTINRFEPIRGPWPEEYGGLALVLGFAALMFRRSLSLTAENRRLTLHLQEEVARKTQALETLLSERRELLAGLIHDVKNPLAAVRSYAELVRGGGVALDRETALYLDALAERVGTVEDRLGLLQGFSKGERGLAGLRQMELNEFLRRFHENNQPDMELSGLTFRLDLPPYPLTVRGDPERLQAALENLCYNAASFTPENGAVTLTLRREGEWALVYVEDTGSGISSEDLPHIFDRGFTHRPDGSGEGLGLYIVRAIALEHGGQVEATSQPGKGSRFLLRLPLSQTPS